MSGISPNTVLYLEGRECAVTLSERVEKESEGWESNQLVEGQKNALVILGTHDEDVGKFSLVISVHHVLNEETGRAFHSYLDVTLSAADLRVMRGYIDFLLSHMVAEGEIV